MDYNLKKTLEWCAENGLTFKVVNEFGVLAITARSGNVFASYAIEEPVTPETVGHSMFAALYSVEHGTKFHQRFGYFPPIRKGDSGEQTGTSEHSIADSSNGESTAPHLYTHPETRRG